MGCALHLSDVREDGGGRRAEAEAGAANALRKRVALSSQGDRQSALGSEDEPFTVRFGWAA